MKADLDPSVFSYVENFVKLHHLFRFYDTKSHIAGNKSDPGSPLPDAKQHQLHLFGSWRSASKLLILFTSLVLALSSHISRYHITTTSTIGSSHFKKVMISVSVPPLPTLCLEESHAVLINTLINEKNGNYKMSGQRGSLEVDPDHRIKPQVLV